MTIARIAPTEGANRNTIMPPHVLKVYESSEEGLVSVVLFPEDPLYRGGYVTAGTRLTREQVKELADALCQHYYGETLGQSFNRGHDIGYDLGHEFGFDLGHDIGFESGLERGRDEVA